MKHSHNTGMVYRLFAVAAFIFLTESLWAQDPVKVDSVHHTVVFENDDVRVIRVQFGPQEKGVMHEHPNSVVIFLTDFVGRFTFPDGKTVDRTGKAGQAIWAPAVKHQFDNIGDKPLEGIQVELKPRKAKTE
ncbi:MAG TPA: hypothetical protein VNI77_12280 [Nitrososphaera sp.]|nr:hypothetical protein [Nitrososphaera sp.]